MLSTERYFDGKAFLAFSAKVHDSSGKNDSTWLLDIGATHHLTSDEGSLADAIPYVWI